ncbi:MAG TPA: 50S ribosomal protein L29 [Planctomycetota bacterium]|nr:50S ribosomal protein L29 [Planctomycetota bacterium]
MADTKKKNFRDLPDEDLRKELGGLSKSLHGLRTQTVTSTVENKSQFRAHRRDIARILTELRARELKAPQLAPAAAAKPAASASSKAAADKPKKKAEAKP